MRIKNVIVGLSVAFFAFSGLFILLAQNAPKIIRYYCQGHTGSMDPASYEVDSCVESILSKPLFNSASQ